MRIFSSVPDGLAYVFTALIGFAFLVLLYLLFDWLRLRRRMGQMDEQLATAERERSRNARNLGSMERQKDILQEQLRKANVERESLAHRLAETTGLLTAARDELAQRPAPLEAIASVASEMDDHEAMPGAPDAPESLGLEEDSAIIQTLTAEPDAARHGLHAQTHDQAIANEAPVNPQAQETVVTSLNAELEDMRAFLDQQRRAALQIRSGQETQIAELQTQLQTLKTSYADLQSTVGQYEAQLSKQHAFMAAVPTVPVSTTEFEAQITALNTTLAEAESAVAQEREQAHSTIATIQQQLQSAQAQLAQAQAEAQAIQGRAATFEAQVHDLLTQVGTANSAIIERDAALAERDHALAKREGELAERDAALANLDAQLKAALAKPATPSAEWQAAPLQASTLAEATDAAADLRQQLAERERGMLLLNSQVVKLQSRLVHATETLAQLQTNGHGVGQVPAAQSQPQSPTWSTLAMEQKEVVMPSERDPERDADFESAKQIIAQRDARVFELEEALAAHRNAATTAQQDLESAKSLLSLRDAQVSELEERIADLREQMQQHAAEMDVANATLAERIETISELNQELDARDQSEPASGASNANDEIDALKAELAASQQTILKLQEQLQQAAATPAKSSAKARQERNAQAAQMAELTIQIHEAQEKIAEKGEAVTALTDKLKAANRELEAAKLKMAEDGDEINALYARLNALAEAAATPAAPAMPAPTTPAKPKSKSSAWVSAATEDKEDDAADGADASEDVEVEAARPKPTRVSRVSKPISVAAPAITPPEKKKPKVAKAAKANREGDDLEGLEGIGPIYATKLRRAGVRSFKALAKAKPSQIEKIIKPKDWQKIDFAHWIAQAKARAKKSE